MNTLTKDELEFCVRVGLNPNSKYGAEPYYDENGNPLWTNPEKLGIVKSTGSYKFELSDDYCVTHSLIKKNDNKLVELNESSTPSEDAVDVRCVFCGKIHHIDNPECEYYDDAMEIIRRELHNYVELIRHQKMSAKEHADNNNMLAGLTDSILHNESKVRALEDLLLVFKEKGNVKV